MTAPIEEGTMVRELAGKYPQTLAVFERFGIDYCCGGNMDLATAAERAGVNLEKLLEALDASASELPPADKEIYRDWWNTPASELADHIESRHHAYLRRELPRLRDLLAKVRKAHGLHHGPMLDELAATFADLAMELDQHMGKEEGVLFPLIRDLDDASRGVDVPLNWADSVANIISQMEHEHENAGEALLRIRKLTDDYTLPADACPTFSALYEGLKALEADLHRHVHLENNILYPRATELEEFDHREATENVPVPPT